MGNAGDESFVPKELLLCEAAHGSEWGKGATAHYHFSF